MRKTYPLRALGEVIVPDETRTPVDATAMYRIAGVYGFGRGLFERNEILGSETRYEWLRRLESGRLVVSRLKAFEGAVAVVPSRLAGCYVSPEFPTFVPRPDACDARYLGFLCRSPDFWQGLARHSKGVGARRERIHVEQVMETEVPLPDLAEQRRVADRLESAFARLDAAGGQVAHAERLRGACAEAIVSRPDLNDAARRAAGWPPVRLGELVRLDRTPLEVDPIAEYVRIGVRSFGKGVFSYAPTIGSALGKLRFFELPAEALVVSNIKAWEGAIAATDSAESGRVCSNRFLTYRVEARRVDLRWLRHFLLSAPGIGLLGRASPGSADRNRTLAIERFEALEVPLPDLAEQQRAARRLTLLDAVAACRAGSRSRLDALGASLLNAAFSGRL